MRTTLFLLAGVLAAVEAAAAQLACPAVAPAEWGVGRKSLESVRVISYPAGQTPGQDRDYYATPPWEAREKAGHIFQTWHLNEDAIGFTYEVDCVYAGTNRHFSLNVAASRICVARWRARRDHGVAARSLHFVCN